MTMDVAITYVVSRDILGHVVGEFDSLDPPLSFDILLGILLRSDEALAFSFMDLSFSFSYSSVSSIDDINECAPHSPTSYVQFIDV